MKGVLERKCDVFVLGVPCIEPYGHASTAPYFRTPDCTRTLAGLMGRWAAEQLRHIVSKMYLRTSVRGTRVEAGRPTSPGVRFIYKTGSYVMLVKDFTADISSQRYCHIN